MAIATVLIDDENMALDQLRFVLQQYQELNVLASFTDPLKALAQINMLKPDLVFLDIEMPEVNGLAVAHEILKRLPEVFIVFVTAFDDYALRAFEANALDYVLKPVTKRRINQTIQRLIRYFDSPVKEDSKNQAPAYSKLERVKKLNIKEFNKIFVIEENEKIILLNPTDVILFTVVCRDVIVVTKDREYKTKQTLNYWEERLANSNYFRCHRSFLVNLDKIEKIMPMFNNTYLLKMADYLPEVPVSRNNAHHFEQILGL